jgi:hypothetical protein
MWITVLPPQQQQQQQPVMLEPQVGDAVSLAAVQQVGMSTFKTLPSVQPA